MSLELVQLDRYPHVLMTATTNIKWHYAILRQCLQVDPAGHFAVLAGIAFWEWAGGDHETGAWEVFVQVDVLAVWFDHDFLPGHDGDLALLIQAAWGEEP